VALQIKTDQVAAHVSPMFYGLMTEEIIFPTMADYTRSWFAIAASRKMPKSRCIWQLVRNRADGAMSLDPSQPPQ